MATTALAGNGTAYLRYDAKSKRVSVTIAEREQWCDNSSDFSTDQDVPDDDNSNSEVDDDRVVHQLLRESLQAAMRPLAEAESDVLETKPAVKTRLIMRRRLLTWAELAPWQQPGSEFILTGYREASGSYSACLHSWTYLHNESVNILSHVIGAIVFYSLTAALWLDSWPWASSTSPLTNSTADRLAATAYLLGVAICFTLSALFHTILSHSAECATRGMAIDMTGVLVLMAGAVVPLVHFGLACGPFWVRLGFHVATAVLGTLAAPLPLWPTTTASTGFANGHHRAALFCGFAAVSFAGPLLWMHLTDPVDWPARVSLWPGVLGTLLGNTAGAVAYTTRFPERWWPRRFDLVGASHQVMHVAVLAAAVAYAVGVHEALAFRRGAGAVCRNGWTD
ncbi:hypothetical protein SEUCBS139899_008084 [Sporothrix eucalyptigena]|uniref:Uncharacterized protein n=1 Tax=Sporothrix eucalyptigena TaxID=1812306 RepID=A0ABP0CHU1_9PEZI